MLRHAAVIGAILLAFGPPAVEDPFVEPPMEGFSVQIVNERSCGGGAFLLDRPDNSAIQLWDGSQGVQVSHLLGVTYEREVCQHAFDVSLPEGYTYAVARVIQRGMGELADGVKATLRTGIGYTSTSSYIHVYDFAEPFENFWEMAHDIQPEHRVWSPCGAPHRLRVMHELRLSVGTAARNTISYLIFHATVPEDAGTTLELIWKRCSPESPIVGAGMS